MEADTYAVEARTEVDHWWFRGRRILFGRELSRTGIGRDGRVLDIGTSTGTNLRLLRQLGFAHVEGLDNNQNAIRFCADKGLGQVHLGDVCAMPFPAATFDLVLATDIIEHVDDDLAALKEIIRIMKPQARVLLTVPAFASLWGLQDRVAQHRRRYRRRMLISSLRSAGLAPERCYHFNYLLFVPIWLARRIIDLLKVDLASEAQVNSPWLNRVLGWIFDLDIMTAPMVRPPFGVSLLVVAKKA